MNTYPEVPTATPDFLRDGGTMGALIRAFDWEATPLGATECWPLPLRTAVRIMLTTNHPVFIWWGSSLRCFYNDAYSRSIGPEKHPSILGMTAEEAWPEIWDIISPQIEYVMNGNGSTWHEDHLVPIDRHGKKSDVVYWTYSYSPIDDSTATNGVGGVLVLCNETTERVFAGQRFKAAEERWQKLFDQSPGFMCVLSGPCYVFEFANPAYYELIKCSDLIGKTIEEALPWAVEQGFITLLDKVYKTGIPYTAHAVPLVIHEKDKNPRSVRYLDFVYQPVKNDQNETIGIFVLGSDVTEGRLAQEALKEVAQRKDVFLATLAHELRNPLSPIQTGIEILRKAGDNPAMISTCVGMMQRQVSHLVRLVDDLLDISRITQGKVTLLVERIDLRDVISRAVEASSSSIYNDEKQVFIDLPLDPLYIKGDSVRLVQVVANLLNNAGKHTKPGGKIWITAATDGPETKICIKDDGIGIVAEMLDKLFDLFVQIPSKSNVGLGIGLALVRKLVELHGGSARAYSDGLGHGSKFVICLPSCLNGLLEEPVVLDEYPELNCWHRKILVVDDNKDAAESMKMLLTLLEAQVQTVHDGNSALEAINHFCPDVVLLDLDMPGMNGYDVARKVRSFAHCENITLIALTGWGQEGVRQRVLTAGFNHHLVKPVNLQALEKIMQTLN